jgi:hypothetical protein
MRLATVVVLLLFTGAIVATGAAQTADPKMTTEEREHVIKLLKDSQKEFLESTEKLTDAQWNFKSPPIDGRERWSIAECAEHIMLSEAAIFGRVEAAMAAPVNPNWEAKTGKKTAFLERILPDRSGKATAPEAITPKSNITRAEIMARYKELRAKTIKFAETTDAPLKEHTVDNPFPAIGTLNGYQWLIYVPLHNIRHNLQLNEVKTYEGYPK